MKAAHPTLEVSRLEGCEDVYLFEVFSSEDDENSPVFLCVATKNRVKLFVSNNAGTSFVLRKEYIVPQRCSCIHFTRHSVLVGCDRFYQVTLGNRAAEEFLDASDSSLAYVVFGLKQIRCSPLAILDVTVCPSSTGDVEFLLCFCGFGIFVDG